MSADLLSTCSDGCGWIAAILSVICLGSYGVPIRAITIPDVHPLVIQTFKTFICFVSSIPIAYLLNEPIRWTWWGLVSGIFGVPGAACGIYGIRNAGLAVAVGTWSSIIVLTSFVFGILVFKERVHSLSATIVAFVCLLVGLVGMAKYSAPQNDNDNGKSYSKVSPTPIHHHRDASSSSEESECLTREVSIGSDSRRNNYKAIHITPLEVESQEAVLYNHRNNDDRDVDEDSLDDDNNQQSQDRIVIIPGYLILTRRQLGILCAVINGSWGGLNLIPLHYAQTNQGFTGPSYLFSYAAGSFAVNLLMWLAIYIYYATTTNFDLQAAANKMPNFYICKLLAPGFSAGILYSLGNFSCILAVSYLGQGTGYSFCQMSLFVSGLWGVTWFREIQGVRTVSSWFVSASIAMVGIIWLSYEHQGSTSAV